MCSIYIMEFDIRRIYYFLGLCITTRLTIAWLAWKYPKITEKIGLVALLPAMGWLYIYFVSGRDTGAEVFGGKIWWNQLRVPHAMLWSLAALYSQRQSNLTWIPLLIDALLGLTSWIVNYSHIVNIYA